MVCLVEGPSPTSKSSANQSPGIVRGFFMPLKPERMSTSGHVWTAPWQELFDASAALVGCGHVSGLLMRRVWPLALMLCADQPAVRTSRDLIVCTTACDLV